MRSLGSVQFDRCAENIIERADDEASVSALARLLLRLGLVEDRSGGSHTLQRGRNEIVNKLRNFLLKSGSIDNGSVSLRALPRVLFEYGAGTWTDQDMANLFNDWSASTASKSASSKDSVGGKRARKMRKIISEITRVQGLALCTPTELKSRILQLEYEDMYLGVKQETRGVQETQRLDKKIQ